MLVILDIMIGMGAVLAAAYCMVLSRRLRALTRLDGDVGKAIAVLSAQVDALTRVLKEAEGASGQAGAALSAQIAQADATARRLELLMAAGNPAGRANVDAAARSVPSAPKPPEDADGFAPFRRATPAPRPRVLRQRDPAGALR